MYHKLINPDTLKKITIPVSFFTYRAWSKGTRCPMNPYIKEVYKENGNYYLTGKFQSKKDAEIAAYYLKCAEQPFCYEYDFSKFNKTEKINRLVLHPFVNYENLETWCSYHPNADIKLTSLNESTQPTYYRYVDVDTFEQKTIPSTDSYITTNPEFSKAIVIEGHFSLEDLTKIADEITLTQLWSVHRLVSKQCGYWMPL